jgi:fructose-1,6-bisphosphatase/inositol monophosphatase family enzyme
VVADVDAGDLRAAGDLAASLARDAGALQVRERPGVTAGRGARVTSKAHANDLVSDVDRASEELIVDGLRVAFPDDGVLGEEGAGVAGASGRRWVVDPLDGTRNYLSGAGPWAVCIALQGGPDLDDLAYLAAGRLDCGALVGAKLWDVAAGLLLAREAGVVLGGAGGRPAPALILAAAPGLSRAFFACDAAQRLVADGGRSPGAPRAAGVA